MVTAHAQGLFPARMRNKMCNKNAKNVFYNVKYKRTNRFLPAPDGFKHSFEQNFFFSSVRECPRLSKNVHAGLGANEN